MNFLSHIYAVIALSGALAGAEPPAHETQLRHLMQLAEGYLDLGLTERANEVADRLDQLIADADASASVEVLAEARAMAQSTRRRAHESLKNQTKLRIESSVPHVNAGPDTAAVMAHIRLKSYTDACADDDVLQLRRDILRLYELGTGYDDLGVMDKACSHMLMACVLAEEMQLAKPSFHTEILEEHLAKLCAEMYERMVHPADAHVRVAADDGWVDWYHALYPDAQGWRPVVFRYDSSAVPATLRDRHRWLTWEIEKLHTMPDSLGTAVSSEWADYIQRAQARREAVWKGVNAAVLLYAFAQPETWQHAALPEAVETFRLFVSQGKQQEAAATMERIQDILLMLPPEVLEKVRRDGAL